MVAQSATKEITAKVICIINVFFVNCDPIFSIKTVTCFVLFV